MKKPTIRVTKWLGDIPVEAACSEKCEIQQRKRLQLQIELNACLRHFAGLMSSRNP